MIPLAMLSFTGVWIAAPAMVGAQPPRPAPPQTLAIRLATLEQQRKLQLAGGGGRLGGEHGPEGELSSEERV